MVMDESVSKAELRFPLRFTSRLVLAYGHYRKQVTGNPWFQRSDFESVLPAEATTGHGPRQRYFRAVSHYVQLGLLTNDDRIPRDLQPTGRRIRPEGRPTPYKYVQITQLGEAALLQSEIVRRRQNSTIGDYFIPGVRDDINKEITALTLRQSDLYDRYVLIGLPRPRGNIEAVLDAGVLVVAETRFVEQ